MIDISLVADMRVQATYINNLEMEELSFCSERNAIRNVNNLVVQLNTYFANVKYVYHRQFIYVMSQIVRVTRTNFNGEFDPGSG